MGGRSGGTVMLFSAFNTFPIGAGKIGVLQIISKAMIALTAAMRAYAHLKNAHVRIPMKTLPKRVAIPEKITLPSLMAASCATGILLWLGYENSLKLTYVYIKFYRVTSCKGAFFIPGHIRRRPVAARNVVHTDVAAHTHASG